LLAVESAKLQHANAIHDLVTFWADKGDMLHRPVSEVYESIRDFKVARDGDDLVGCSALHIIDDDLAEIRSLAVAENSQLHGVGAALVEACLSDARDYGIERVFALTYRPGFFERQGFRVADVVEFPQKVWNECVRCPFFTDCKEVAVVLEVDRRD
jgi:amino-acid N-acetyltransferase